MLKYIQEVLQTFWRGTLKSKLKQKKGGEDSFGIKKGKQSITLKTLAPDIGNDVSLNKQQDIDNANEVVRLKRTYDILMKKFSNPKLDLASPSMKAIEIMKLLDFRTNQAVFDSTFTNIFTRRKNKIKSPELQSTDYNNKGENLKPVVSNKLSLGWSGQPTDKNNTPKIETSPYYSDIDFAFFAFPEITEASRNKMNQPKKATKNKFKKTKPRNQKKKSNIPNYNRILPDNPITLIKEIPKSRLYKFYNMDFKERLNEYHNKMLKKYQVVENCKPINEMKDVEDKHLLIFPDKSTAISKHEIKNDLETTTPISSTQYAGSRFEPGQSEYITEDETKSETLCISENNNENGFILKSKLAQVDPCPESPPLHSNCVKQNDCLLENTELIPKTYLPIKSNDISNTEGLNNNEFQENDMDFVYTASTESNMRQKENNHTLLNINKGADYSQIETAHKIIPDSPSNDKSCDVENSNKILSKCTNKNVYGTNYITEKNTNLKNEKISEKNQNYSSNKQVKLSPENQNTPLIFTTNKKTHNILAINNTTKQSQPPLQPVILNSLMKDDVWCFRKKEKYVKSKLPHTKSINNKNQTLNITKKLSIKDRSAEQQHTVKNECYQSQNKSFDVDKLNSDDKNMSSSLSNQPTLGPIKYKKSNQIIQQGLSNNNFQKHLVLTTKHTDTFNNISKNNFNLLPTDKKKVNQGSTNNKINSSKLETKTNDKPTSYIIKSDYIKFVKNKAWFNHHFKKTGNKSYLNISFQKNHPQNNNLKIENQREEDYVGRRNVTKSVQKNKKKSKKGLLEKSKSVHYVSQFAHKKSSLKPNNSLPLLKISKNDSIIKKPAVFLQSNYSINEGGHKDINPSLKNKALLKKFDISEQYLKKRVEKILKKAPDYHMKDFNHVKKCLNRSDKGELKLVIADGSKYYQTNIIDRSAVQNHEPSSGLLSSKTSYGTSKYKTNNYKLNISERRITKNKCLPKPENFVIENLYSKPNNVNMKNNKSYLKLHDSKLTGVQLNKNRKLHSKKMLFKSVNLKMYGVEKKLINNLKSEIQLLKSGQTVNKHNSNEKFKKTYLSDNRKSAIRHSKSEFIQTNNILFPTTIQTRNLFTIEHKANAVVNYLLKRYATTVTNQKNESNSLDNHPKNSNLSEVETRNSISDTSIKKPVTIKCVRRKRINYTKENKNLKSNLQNCKSKSTESKTIIITNTNTMDNSIISHKSTLRRNDVKHNKKNGTGLNNTKPINNHGDQNKDYNLEVLYSRKEINNEELLNKLRTRKENKINTNNNECKINVLDKVFPLDNTKAHLSKNINQKIQSASKITHSNQETCSALQSKTLCSSRLRLNDNLNLKDSLMNSRTLHKVNTTKQKKVKRINLRSCDNVNQNICKQIKESETDFTKINNHGYVKSDLSCKKLNKNVKLNYLPPDQKHVDDFEITSKTNSVNIQQNNLDFKNAAKCNSSKEVLLENPKKWKSKRDRLNDRTSHITTVHPTQAKKKTYIKYNFIKNDKNVTSSEPDIKLNMIEKPVKCSNNASQHTLVMDRKEIVSSSNNENLNTLKTQSKQGKEIQQQIGEKHINTTSHKSESNETLLHQLPQENIIQQCSHTKNIRVNQNSTQDIKTTINQRDKCREHNTCLNNEKGPLNSTEIGNNKKTLDIKDSHPCLSNLAKEVFSENIIKNLSKGHIKKIHRHTPKNKTDSQLSTLPLSISVLSKGKPGEEMSKSNTLECKNKLDNIKKNKSNNNSLKCPTLLKHSANQIKQSELPSNSITVLSEAAKRKLDLNFCLFLTKTENDCLSSKLTHNINKESKTLHKDLLIGTGLSTRTIMPSKKECPARSDRQRVVKLMKKKSSLNLKPLNLKTNVTPLCPAEITKNNNTTEIKKTTTLLVNKIKEIPQAIDINQSSDLVLKPENFNKLFGQVLHPIEKEKFSLVFPLKPNIPSQEIMPNILYKSFSGSSSNYLPKQLQNKNADTKTSTNISSNRITTDKMDPNIAKINQIKSWRPERNPVWIKNSKQSNSMQIS